MQWQEEYTRRLVSAKAAISLIRSGDYVATGMLEPLELLWALKERDDLKGIKLFCAQSLQGAVGQTAAESLSDITVVTPFIDPHPALQKALEMGKVEFMPSGFSSWVKLHGYMKECNVLLLSVTKPNAHGYVTLATYPEHVASLIEKAGIVIAEINETLPTTFGGPPIHISQFTKIVESQTNWKFLVREEVGNYWEDEQAKAMGGYLSELIEDGATIELGVGSINGNALLNMEGVKDLGVHTEFFGDVLMEMMKKGVVNNSKKTIHKGYSVCTIGSGSRKFYDFVDSNPSVQFMPSKHVLDVAVIASNYKMTAINTAAQIDLQGQVNGEFIKGRQYSGIGGQGDFAKAACLCPNGKSIMAMASTTKNGAYSKILPFFQEPLTPVTTPRTDVEYVVTEFGIAKLVGESIKQRVKNMIQVAHPKFREELTEQAKQMKLL